MRRTVSGAAIVIVTAIFLLSACDGFNPFIGSAFEGVDGYTAPDLEEMDSDDMTDEILNQDDFLDSLSEEEVEEVITELETALEEVDYTDKDNLTDEDQNLALAVAETYLETSGVEDTLNDVSANLGSLMEGDVNLQESSSLSDFVFGEEASSEDVADQILGLVNSADALENLGSTVDTLGLPDDVVNDSGSLDLGVQVLAASVMNVMVDDIIANDPDLDPEDPEDVAEAVGDLASYLTGETTESPIEDTDFSFMEIDSEASEEEQEQALADALGEGTAALLMETGVTDLLTMFSGGGEE